VRGRSVIEMFPRSWNIPVLIVNILIMHTEKTFKAPRSRQVV
jgi:hypothetical protein